MFIFYKLKETKQNNHYWLILYTQLFYFLLLKNMNNHDINLNKKAK